MHEQIENPMLRAFLEMLKFYSENHDSVNTEVELETLEMLNNCFDEKEFDVKAFDVKEDDVNVFPPGVLIALQTMIANYIIKDKNRFFKIFKSTTPDIFLNILIHLLHVNLTAYFKLAFYFSRVIECVSVVKFVSVLEKEQVEWRSFSEYEYYKMLENRTDKEASIFIEILECDREIKNDLKLLLKNKNEEDFCKKCCQSGLDLSKSAGICSIWKVIHDAFKFMKSEDLEKINKNEVYQNFELLIKDNDYATLSSKNQKVFFTAYDTDSNDAESVLNYFNLDWSYIHNMYKLSEGLFIVLSNKCIEFSSDFQKNRELVNFIKSIPYYNKLSSELTLDNYEKYKYRSLPCIERFREMFCINSSLPSSIGEKKDKKEVLVCRSSVTYEKCERIFQYFKSQNYIQENDHHAFLYRTSIDYNTEEKPSKITWYGHRWVLYYFIYWLSGSNQPVPKYTWARMIQFFVLSNGNPPVQSEASHIIDRHSTSSDNVKLIQILDKI